MNWYKIKNQNFSLKRIIGAVIINILLFASDANAQLIEPDKYPFKDSIITYGQLDIKGLIKEIFAPRHLSHQDSLNILPFPMLKKKNANLEPGKFLVVILPSIGYTIQTGANATLTTNVSFLTGKSDSTNLSTIAINPIKSLIYKQFILIAIPNIWSKKNKFDFLGDYRFYQYPTYTYGLGGHTSLQDADLINYSYVRVYQNALKQIGSTKFYGGLGYNLDYHFDIKEQGMTDTALRDKSFPSGTDFYKYNGNATTTVSSGLSMNFLYDSRKNSNYPIDASVFNFAYRYNSKYMGSNENWQSVYMEYKKFIKVSRRSNNVLAFWNLNWLTFGGKVPYFDLPSTGWDVYSNTARGYIQGRLRGPAMIYVESEYRFRLTKNDLLGGVIFVNAESVPELATYKFETILPAAGLGIRVKIDKLSGVRLAIDYGWGAGGSQGFFFNIAEVF